MDSAFTENEKAALRKALRARRDAMGDALRHRMEEDLYRRLSAMAAIRDAGVLAVYRAFGSEFALDRFPWPAKLLVYPVTLRGGQMEFAPAPPGKPPEWLEKPWIARDRLPEGLRTVPAGHIDAFLVPGLAFDRAGRRLGYGGGYYDRYLARPERRGAAAGVGLRVPEGTIPCGVHDVLMDATVLV